MTLQVDGVDVMQAIEIAALVGSIVVMLVIGLILYLMVRPPRHVRRPPPLEPDAIDVEEMLGLLDRMEQRLEVLERAVGDGTSQDERILEAGLDGSQDRRTK